MDNQSGKKKNDSCILSQVSEEMREEEDYIFRFPIERKKTVLNPDTALVEFYNGQIRDLLKIIFFGKKGKKVIPTEFGFLSEPEKTYSLVDMNLDAY